MSKRMLVNAAQEGEVRVATVEENVLEELNVAIEGNELLKGNLYKAVVVSVESGLQAAFVDYGAERNGFVTFNDIHRKYYNKKIKTDGKRLRIQDAIAPGAELLVQVYKEEVGNKGAALTTDITQPGRYLVLMPFSDGGGVSRKIESESTRTKLKEIITKLNVPDDMGLIVRTAGQGRNKTELQKDYQALIRSWGHSLARYEQLREPGLVYREPDVVIRSVRDYFTDDVTEIMVDNDSVMDRLVEYFELHAPDILPRVKRYKGKMPLFSNFGLERQLENISSPTVGLPSGGSIVINPTEALTAIDVNSGKSRGQSNQEEMALQTNLEAAVEAARQLRLRDLGGLVVIDFIDMYENTNRRSVEKDLKSAMKRDKARVEIGRISRFGLLELSRQRIKARLISSTHNSCPMCEGSGFVMSTEVAAVTMLRRLQELAVSAPKAGRIRGRLPVAVALHLLNDHRSSIADMEQDFDVTIEVIPEIGALSTRDAFEIITKENAEKTREERNANRDRKDRTRNKRRSPRPDASRSDASRSDASRSDASRSDASRSDASRSDDSQNTIDKSVESDMPYEAPKVVGFIEPEDLVETDPGAAPATVEADVQDEEASDPKSESDSESELEQSEGRGRRRRRRRRRKGEDTPSVATEHTREQSQEGSSPNEAIDDAEARRREARERNLARRNSRSNSRKGPPGEQANPTANLERVAKEAPREVPRLTPKESPRITPRKEEAPRLTPKESPRITPRKEEAPRLTPKESPRITPRKEEPSRITPRKESDVQPNVVGNARQSDVAQASRKAAEKLRSRLTKNEVSTPSAKTPKHRAEPQITKAKTASVVEAKQPQKKVDTTSVAALVKAKLKDRSSRQSKVDDAPKAEVSSASKALKPSRPAGRTESPAARRAAEIVKARLASKNAKATDDSTVDQPSEGAPKAKPSRTRASRAKSTSGRPARSPASASTRVTKAASTSALKSESVNSPSTAKVEGAEDTAKASGTPRKTTADRIKSTPRPKAATPAVKRTAVTKAAKTTSDEKGPVTETKTQEKPKAARAATKEPAVKTTAVANSEAVSASDKPKTARASRPKKKAASNVKTKTARTPVAKASTSTEAKPKTARTSRAGSKTEPEAKPSTTRTRRTKAAADESETKPKVTQASKAKATPASEETPKTTGMARAKTAAKPRASRAKAASTSADSEKPKRTRTSRAKVSGSVKAETEKPSTPKPKATATRSKSTTSARSASKKAGDKVRQKQGVKAKSSVDTDHLEREKAASVLATLK
jgi:ribonuclease E